MPATPQEDIREANMRLPEHQREALALRELEQLSYEEIAAILETSPDSVAKLISRARINLSDDLHGTTLAAVAAPSAACERALPLIAAREDGQLEAGSDDDAWLDAHLAGCERCGLAVEAMREAGASYRAWAPIAVLPWLLEETMAKAAALAGVDWSVEIAEGIASRTEPRPTSVMGPADPKSGGGERRSSRGRRRAIAVAALAALLLGGGVAAAMVAGEPTPVSPRLVADTHSADSSGGIEQTPPEAAEAQAHVPQDRADGYDDAGSDHASSPRCRRSNPEEAAPRRAGGPRPVTIRCRASSHRRRPALPSPSTPRNPRRSPRPRPGSPGRNSPVEPVVEETAPESPVKRKSERDTKSEPARPGH